MVLCQFQFYQQNKKINHIKIQFSMYLYKCIKK